MAGIQALIEVLDADGEVRQTFRAAQLPLRLGRSLANDIVLDDPHIAPFHASLSGALSWAEGGVQLTVGSTLNGVQLGAASRRARTLKAGESVALTPGQVWRLGQTSLRVRLADEAVADELPLPAPQRAPWGVAGMGVALIAWEAAEHWLAATPGSDPTEGLRSVLIFMAGAAGWCGFWALGSTLFQRRFAFLAHLKVFVPWMLASNAAEFLLGQLSFMFSMPSLGRISSGCSALMVAVMVWQHLSLLLPKRPQVAAVFCGTAFVVATASNLYMQHKQLDRWFAQLYAGTLSLPSLRMSPAVPASELLDEVRSLQPRLKELAEQPGSGGDSDEED
jgi:hypothetical protein